MSDRTLTQTKLASTLTFTPINGGVLQRKCACGNHTVAGGECKECATNKSGLQRKLAIGASNDPPEREADRVADQVMAPPAHSAVSGPLPRVQRYAGQATEGTDAAPASVDRVLASSGKPLEPALWQDMEQRFDHDFSRVRVHSGETAEQSAREVNANAYTVGNHIVFGTGRFAPGTHEGRRLIVHELTHVVQQSGADGIRAGHGNEKRGLSPISTMPVSIAREVGVAMAPDWHDQLNALLPRGGLLMHMMHLQTLVDMFGPELPALVGAISADKTGMQFVKEHGISAMLALGETSPSHGTINVSRAKAWLIEKPDRYSSKNIRETERERSAAFPEVQGAKKPSFDDALREGADLLGKAEFGLSAGVERGVDEKDGYDARDWEEGSRRGVLVSKVEPWLAINSIVKNIGKPVKKAGGGTTLWSFDCFDFVTVLRVYAYWRTLSRTEFNTKFNQIELGFFAKSPLQWEQTIEASRAGEKPFKSGGTEVVPGTMTFREVKIPVGQSWKQLVDNAPVGTQITWGNTDAKIKCTKDPNLGFCAYMYENTTKLGQDTYSAHPMGVVNEKTIKEEMAKAVFEGKAVPPGYIEKNIFISGMRVPVR